MKLLKFEAVWCQPCHAIKVPLEEIAREHNLELEVIDVDKDGDRAGYYGVQALPTVILLNDDSSFRKQFSGAYTKEKMLDLLSL